MGVSAMLRGTAPTATPVPTIVIRIRESIFRHKYSEISQSEQVNAEEENGIHVDDPSQINN